MDKNTVTDNCEDNTKGNTTTVSVEEACAAGDGGGNPDPDPTPGGSSSPIIKGYFAGWSPYNASEPTGFPGCINKVPTGGTWGQPDRSKLFDQNTQKMEDKLAELDEVVYSFLEIKQNTNPNVVAEAGPVMSSTSTTYTHNAEDVGKVFFFDAWGDLQASDAPWISKHGDLISEGYLDAVNGIENIQWNLGYGNFSAFANHNGDFKKIVALGGYGDHFQPGWEAATRAGSHNFITSLKTVMDHFNLDGIDLDWEPLSLISDNNMQADFINMVQSLRDTFPDKFIGFPITVNQDQIEAFGADNWAALNDLLDEIGIMGYDMHGAFDNPKLTGLQAMLYPIDPPCDETGFSSDTAIKMLMDYGIDAEKITLGYPSYSRGLKGVEKAALGVPFTGVDENANLDPTTGIATYTWLQKQLADNANAEEKVVYVNNDATGGEDVDTGTFLYLPDTKAFHSYDNEQSVAAKAQYVVDNNLRGTLTWLIENDLPIGQGSLIDAVREVFDSDVTPDMI